jgi:hypothetical protein
VVPFGVSVSNAGSFELLASAAPTPMLCNAATEPVRLWFASRRRGGVSVVLKTEAADPLKRANEPE